MDERTQNYAQALYSLLTSSEREQALEALRQICVDFQNQPQFARLLRSYSLSASERKSVLLQTYGKAYSSIPHLLSFLQVLCDHHRMGELPGITRDFASLLNADTGVKEGLVYSAEKLSKEQLKDLEEAFAKRLGSKVSLSNVVDHRLLGGVKVAIDGKVFDGSLASKLEGLHRTLKGGSLS